jgi:hypothetical protein
MKENKATAPSASTKKRDPGFVKIRRGLLPHLTEMSSNAVKLYVWFHIRAYWFGPKRGLVEASPEDIMCGLGWSKSMVRRTVKELARKGYIRVVAAVNQHQLTRIKILKYELEKSISAVSTGEQSKNSAVSSAVSTSEQSSEHSNHSNPQMSHDLSDHKNAKNIRSVEADAVRRQFDAERRVPGSGFSPSAKREKLHARLAAKIAAAGDSYSDYIRHCQRKGREHPFGKLEREAFAALRYQPDLDSPLVSSTFVATAREVYQENRGKGLSPGILCCKVIDRLDRYRKEDEKWASQSGRPSDGYFYPPDFKEHRDQMRAQERAREQSVPADREARA